MIPFRDDRGKLSFAPVTALSVLVWSLSWFWMFRSSPDVVRRIELGLGIRPEAWRELAGKFGDAQAGHLLGIVGQLAQPLFTYHVLHASVVHCATNVLFFWVFGARLETRAGSLRFAAFLLASGAVAGVTYAIVASDASAAGLGASGVVAATMAAYLCLYPRGRAMVLVPVVVVPVVVMLPSAVLICIWIALQLRPISRLLEIGPAGPLSWPAIVAGAVAGTVLTFLLLRPRSEARKPSPS